MLNSNNQELMREDFAGIRKHNALEEYEDAEEPGPALIERTMTALKLTEELLLIEAHVKVLEDVDSNEQRAAPTRQGTSRRLLAMRRLCKTRRCLCLAQIQCLISSSHLQGLGYRHLYCWTLEMMIQMTQIQFTK
jgi:hypothetical protein